MNAQQKPPMDRETLAKLAVATARTQSQNRGVVANVNGSLVFATGDDWEATILKQADNFVKVGSLAALREALEDVDAVTLLVLKSAALPLAEIEEALRLSGQQKTIYIEGSAI